MKTGYGVALLALGLCVGFFAPLSVSMGLAALILAIILIGNRNVGA